MHNSQQLLSLFVTNPQNLEKGSLPHSRFDEAGGMVGSDEGCHWKLDNYAETIAPTHCEIMFVSNDFCLIDRSGDTFVNAAHRPLGKDAAISLKTGDTIKIAEYMIKVSILQYTKVDDAQVAIEDLLQMDSSQVLSSGGPMIDAPLNKVEDALLLEKDVLDPLLFFDKSKVQQQQAKNDVIPSDNLGVSHRVLLSSDQSSTNIESVTDRKTMKGVKKNEDKSKE